MHGLAHILTSPGVLFQNEVIPEEIYSGDMEKEARKYSKHGNKTHAGNAVEVEATPFAKCCLRADFSVNNVFEIVIGNNFYIRIRRAISTNRIMNKYETFAKTWP